MKLMKSKEPISFQETYLCHFFPDFFPLFAFLSSPTNSFLFPQTTFIFLFTYRIFFPHNLPHTFVLCFLIFLHLRICFFFRNLSNSSFQTPLSSPLPIRPSFFSYFLSLFSQFFLSFVSFSYQTFPMPIPFSFFPNFLFQTSPTAPHTASLSHNLFSWEIL